MVRSFVVAVLAAVAVLVAAPPASAEPREVCGPHSPEETVVRVFPRGEETSSLLCGTRYYGFRRIDWSAVSLDAIARTLASPASSTWDERSATWTVEGPGATVVIARHGQVITARAA
ncbi:hypothetical protein WCD74_03475 [Actinomycetospora sp. OC33-EN08]|uniref:Uncharacterized protein n=1 Tax=Actinomycetospora aurantiaca TaxID=3129233 RepID=A0ABU8MHP1_9PSEU